MRKWGNSAKSRVAKFHAQARQRSPRKPSKHPAVFAVHQNGMTPMSGNPSVYG